MRLRLAETVSFADAKITLSSAVTDPVKVALTDRLYYVVDDIVTLPLEGPEVKMIPMGRDELPLSVVL